MTNNQHGQVPEALRLAEAITNMICSSETAAKTIAAAADELCRLHVENAALRAAHVQNPAEIEHVAGDVSKNGVETNMSTQQPAPAGATPDATWCAYVAGMICTYLKEDADGAKAKAIAGIIERRLMFLAVTPQPAPATQQAGEVSESIEQLAVARYKVVPAHESMFHRWAVVAGDGAQQLYLGREVECENMARKFAGAFLDGAFVAMQNAAPQPSPTAQAAESVPEAAHSMAVAMLNEMHQRMGADVVRKCNFDSLAFERIAQRHMEAALVGRKDLQMTGSHPAPCGKFCEAQAFRIENRNLKSQLAAARAPAESVLEDAARWQMAVLVGNEVLMHPDKRSNPAAVKAYMDAVHSGLDFTGAVDAARKQGGV